MKTKIISNIAKCNEIEISAIHGRYFYRFLQLTIFCFVLFGIVTAQKTDDKEKNEHSNHKHHSEQKSDLTESSDKNPNRKFTIPNVQVLTQEGKQVEFFNDLVKGKKVLISFIFTTCRLTCPMVGRNFEKIQNQLGDKLGKDVSLITVSTDPLVDTPDVIKKWGEKFNRREGWTLVTGDEATISELLVTLTGSSRQVEGRHTSLVILYDGASENWKTTSSVIEPVILLDELNKLASPGVK